MLTFDWLKTNKMKLNEIGFWDTNNNKPQTFVDENWWQTCSQGVKDWISLYLKGRLFDIVFLESYEMGYSYCRFGCELSDPKVMGACTLTDGTYCWPEGYIHYIKSHYVKPPAAFLHHMLQQYDTYATTTATHLQMYDIETHSPQPIPQSIQQWLTSHTTLDVSG